MQKYLSKRYQCPVFFHEGICLLLPTWFSVAISAHREVFAVNEFVDRDTSEVKRDVVERSVEETTVTQMLSRITLFIQWVEEYAENSEKVSLHNHHNLPDTILNYYVNDVLIGERGKGYSAIAQTIMTLNVYYMYLAQAGLTTEKNLYIKPSFKERARTNTNRRTSVKYLTPELRSILYRHTNSIRDELLLKTAGELSCRSMENRGFVLNDFNVGRKKYPGMLSLFAKMESSPEQMEFEFYLQGKYSKAKRGRGGESRVLYIHRDLLLRFKEYCDEERPSTDEDILFVNNSNNEVGTPIQKSKATRVFKEVRDAVLEKQEKGLLPEWGQKLEIDHTHHVLRHSFGTDKFWEFSEERGMRVDDVTSTSQPYLTVAALMGHSASDRSAPKTTKIYIRTCKIKEAFEMGGDNG